MRISPATSQTLLNALKTADLAEQTALSQMTTGRRVNLASDDPAAAAVEVGIANQSSRCDQFQRSISSVSSELQTADSALNSTVTSLQRALTLGVEGANGTLSQTDRAALAADVKGISEQLMSTANLVYNGKYLFAGTADSQPPYVADSSVTGGVRYQGNGSMNQVETQPGRFITINQPGDRLFSVSGANVFEALGGLADALQSDTSSTQEIGDATEAVRQAYDQLNSSRVFYGSTLDQLNSDQDFLSTEKLQLSQQMNAAVGVDTNQAATNLVNAESARNAALQAAARTSSLSLLDYLSGTSN